MLRMVGTPPDAFAPGRFAHPTFYFEMVGTSLRAFAHPTPYAL
jgi:hypothetical protein